MMNEMISVIVPVYNVEQYLPECIDSITEQTYRNIEIILVNDGSTDSSREIIDQYMQRDNRIKCIDQANSGQAAARNAGLAAATGAYIVFVDSDDYLERCMFEQLMEKMHSSGADIVECGYYETYERNGAIQNVPFEKTYGEKLDPEDILRANVAGEISLLIWNKLYKASCVQDVRFDETKKYEDVLWSAKAMFRAKKISCIQTPMYYWRQRAGSTTHTGPMKSRLVVVEHFDDRIGMVEKYPAVHRLARSRIICECYLEYNTMKKSDDAALVELARQHSLKYYHKNKLNLWESLRLGSVRETVRHYYYVFRFWKEHGYKLI